MRAIDADAFAEYLKDAVKRQKYENTKIDKLLTVDDVIEAVISELEGTSLAGFKNAPTIEPERKKGKWIKMSDADGDYYCCDQCGEELPRYMTEIPSWDRPYPHKQSIDKTDFCPNCGAYMR